MKLLRFILLVTVVFPLSGRAQDAVPSNDRPNPSQNRPAVYPFDVTVDGQLATVAGNAEYAIFARIAHPLANDAEMVLGAEPETIFVNIFPCDAEGVIARKDQANAKVIMSTEPANRVKLNETMDKSFLEDGWYLMNVVLRSLGTSRVVFQVGKAAPVDAPATDQAIDQSTPEGALKAVFSAAKSGKLAPLAGLLPPSGNQDGDVERVCGVAKAGEKDQVSFRSFFSQGKVSGEAKVSDDGNSAQLDFLFGPDGTKQETMNLVRENGKWYLSSF